MVNLNELNLAMVRLVEAMMVQNLIFNSFSSDLGDIHFTGLWLFTN